MNSQVRCECVSALTCLLEVLHADVVNGEECGGGAVLWAHVGDGGTVSDGQLGNAWAEELHKLTHDSHLTQVLTGGEGGRG